MATTNNRRRWRSRFGTSIRPNHITTENGRRPASAMRRPVAIAEPGAVVRHLRALRRRRMALAGRALLAVVRRRPAQLDAVVGVIGHLELDGPANHVLDR